MRKSNSTHKSSEGCLEAWSANFAFKFATCFSAFFCPFSAVFFSFTASVISFF